MSAIVFTAGAIVAVALGSVGWGIGLLAAAMAGGTVLIVLVDRRRASQLRSLETALRRQHELISGISTSVGTTQVSVNAMTSALKTLDARSEELSAAVKDVDTRTDQMQRRILATLEVSRLEAADRAREMNAEASH